MMELRGYYSLPSSAQQVGPKYYSQPVEYKGVVFAIERFIDCMPEVIALGIKEWKEVGDEDRFGRFSPDIARASEFERAGGLYVFTLRSLRTMVLEGYIIMTVSPSLKQAGKLVAYESAIYLQPSARDKRPWLMKKVMAYMESFFTEMGVHAIELGHRADENGYRAGKFYERSGYFPATVVYHKVLDNEA